jgi:hypothetical protein
MSLEVLPDFEGPEEDDVTLHVLGDRHRSPGHTEDSLAVGKIEEEQWKQPEMQKGIEAELRKLLAGGTTGFAASYYTAKETFKDDAMTCWVRDHNRDPGCSDYKSDKKLLKPGTSYDRKKLGLPESRTKVYLCDFCPVKSLVQKKHFEKLGHYN